MALPAQLSGHACPPAVSLPGNFGSTILALRFVACVPGACQAKHNWVLTSIFFMELLAGVTMAIIGALLVIFRWPELCQVGRAVFKRFFGGGGIRARNRKKSKAESFKMAHA